MHTTDGFLKASGVTTVSPASGRLLGQTAFFRALAQYLDGFNLLESLPLDGSEKLMINSLSLKNIIYRDT